MGTTYLDRRQLLKGLGAGALAAGAAATLSPATVLARDDHKGLVGGWNLNVHPTPPEAAFTAAASFAAGGVMGTADSRGVGSTGFGVWKQQEDNTFVFKFTVFDFRQGKPGVTVVVSGRGTVSGNSLQGTVSVTVPAGTFPGGTFDGTRMTV